MIEPEAPVTFHVDESPFPALILGGDAKVQLHPYSVILRHRHVKQQFNVILEYVLFLVQGTQANIGVPIKASAQ